MGRFALRRALQGLVVILGVTIVVFVVTRLVGDPVSVLLPLDASDEARRAAEARLGFDRPIAVQFAEYMRSAVQFDFGESLWQRRDAMAIVIEKLPATFLLVFTSMGLAVALAIPIGVLAALKPGRLLDRFVVTSSLLGLSMPQFWLGLVFILVFAVNLGWLPTSGSGSLRHLVLPALTLALPAAARLGMLVRSSMIDELNQPYVQTAKAKNLPFLRIVGTHAFRNASVPALTLAGWELIRALAGYTVVVETVFAWPGLGFTAIQAIERQDLILVQAIVFLVALIIVVINVMIDIAHKAVDPRVKLA